MKKLWAKLRPLLDGRFWRFLLVGVINTLVGSAIMFGLYDLADAGYWLSSAANYILTSILSFFLNKYFTFRSHGRSFAEVMRFVLNIAVCWLLAYGIAKPLMLYLLSEAPKEEQNFEMLMFMLECARVMEEDEQYQSPLDLLKIHRAGGAGAESCSSAGI